MAPALSGQAVALSPNFDTDNTVLFIGAVSGTVRPYVSTDSGETFARVEKVDRTPWNPSTHATCAIFVSEGIFCGTTNSADGHGDVYASYDQGASWTLLEREPSAVRSLALLKLEGKVFLAIATESDGVALRHLAPSETRINQTYTGLTGKRRSSTDVRSVASWGSTIVAAGRSVW